MLSSQHKWGNVPSFPSSSLEHTTHLQSFLTCAEVYLQLRKSKNQPFDKVTGAEEVFSPSELATLPLL